MRPGIGTPGDGETTLDALTLARWQFGIVTVYHFLFVPITLGLSVLVALMQTAWYRTGNAKYLAMTKFWGKICLLYTSPSPRDGLLSRMPSSA